MASESFLHRRLASFRYAFVGIRWLFATQVHAWLHLAATVGVIAAGIWFSVSSIEWCLLVLATGLVWVAEAINTAIEFAVDVASPERNRLAGMAKDIAAGAVLLSAVTAAITGLLIFGPRLMQQ